MIFPCVQVFDIETSIEWYSHFLGFECTFKNRTYNPEYAILEKSDLKIYLSQSQNKDNYASNLVVIETSELAKELDIINNNGVLVVQQISNGIFGTKEFIIKDYEDNKIIYKQRAQHGVRPQNMHPQVSTKELTANRTLTLVAEQKE